MSAPDQKKKVQMHMFCFFLRKLCYPLEVFFFIYKTNNTLPTKANDVFVSIIFFNN